MRNLYKVLGIAASADDQRIKSAFRRRAKKTHPDLNPGDKMAEERFRELLQAYEVLRDAHARALYDAQLAQRRREAWRRFAHSAAVMVATFLLTTTSAFVVLGQQGISVHSETWQIATAWLTSVEVAPSEPAVANASSPAAGKDAARSSKPGSESAASMQKKAAPVAQKSVAVQEKRAPATRSASASASRGQDAEPMPEAWGGPFGLGASSLR